MPKTTLENYKNQVNTVRQNIRQNNAMSREEQIEAIAILLTNQAFDTASLQETSTARKIKETWEKNYAVYKTLAEEFFEAKGQRKIKSILQKNDNDKTLVTEVINFVAQKDRIPEGLCELLRPKAINRVNSLKNRIKNGDFKTVEEKRRVLAEILAAREAVSAGRSGTFFLSMGLYSKVPADVSSKADIIENELKNVPEDVFDRQYRNMSNRTFGGAMQEVFAPYRKTAVVRELEEMLGSAVYNSPNNIKDNAPRFIWLLRNQDMSDDEYNTKKSQGQIAEEIEQIKMSQAYYQFVESMPSKDFVNMFNKIGPYKTEANKKVLDAYGKVEEDLKNADPWASELYDSLMSDGGKLGDFTTLIGMLCSPEMINPKGLTDDQGSAENLNLREAIHKKSNSYYSFFESIKDLNEALFDMDDRNKFIECANILKEKYATIANSFKDNDSIFQRFPDLEKLKNILDMPEKKTAEYVALLQRGALEIKAENVSYNEIVTIIFNQAALYELTKDAPDWKTVLIDEETLSEKMHEIHAKFDNELIDHLYDDYPIEELASIVRAPGNGKRAAELCQKILAGEVKEVEKKNPLTVEDRIEEYTGLPTTKQFLASRDNSVYDIVQAQKEVLTARMLKKEYAEHPQNFKSVKDVNDFIDAYESAYKYVIGRMHDKDAELGHLELRAEENGKVFEEVFKKALPGGDNIRYMKLMDASHQPTARKHIEALQEHLEKNDYTDTNEGTVTHEEGSRLNKVKSSLAQIIAAREILNVRPGIKGGDERLNGVMNTKIYERAEQIKSLIDTLTEDELETLRVKACKGHGGELQEDFKNLMTKKASEKDVLPENLPDDHIPTAKQRIKSMQDKLKHSESVVEKRRCLAQIIAARQMTGAKRGSFLGGADERLNNKLNPEELAQIVDDVDDYLSRMPENVLNQLIRKAGDGHGGAMMEEYQRQNTYENQFKWIQETFANADPEAVKPVLAKATSICTKTILLKEDRNTTIDEKEIRARTNNAKENPAYAVFVSNPDVPGLIASGDFKALNSKWLDAIDTVQRERMSQLGHNMGQNAGPNARPVGHNIGHNVGHAGQNNPVAPGLH